MVIIIMRTKSMDISIRNSLVVSAEFMPRLVRERGRDINGAGWDTFSSLKNEIYIARKDYHNNNITFIYVLEVHHDVHACSYLYRFPTKNSVTGYFCQ